MGPKIVSHGPYANGPFPTLSRPNQGDLRGNGHLLFGGIVEEDGLGKRRENQATHPEPILGHLQAPKSPIPKPPERVGKGIRKAYK